MVLVKWGGECLVDIRIEIKKAAANNAAVFFIDVVWIAAFRADRWRPLDNGRIRGRHRVLH